MQRLVIVAALAVLTLAPAGAAIQPIQPRSLDGSGNNVRHADWGAANTHYVRVGAPSYADGVAAMVSGPPARYISNRVFNDVGQNLFSENDVSQWGWAWGQFIDHDIGLRDETPGEAATIGFDAGDPLESFTNDFGAIGFSRMFCTRSSSANGSTSRTVPPGLRCSRA